MRIDRLGELLGQKYGLRTEAADYPPRKPTFPLPTVTRPLPSMAEVEASIRSQLDSLWDIPNKTYNILRACSDAGVRDIKTEEEQKVYDGFVFCRKVMSIIDVLKSQRSTLSLSEIRHSLETLRTIIMENQLTGDSERQFPHVALLVDMVLPRTKRHLYDEKQKKQQRAKMRAGLSRILSLSITILNEMNILGGADEVGGRFDPQVSAISNDEIVWFVRHHGGTYSIPDVETFQTVIDINPDLERPLTKLVRSLARGKVPRGADRFKSIIQNIIRKRQQITQTNVPALEKEEPGPNPLTLFEEEDDEESKAWDAKMAFKYNDLALGNLLRKGNL